MNGSVFDGIGEPSFVSGGWCTAEFKVSLAPDTLIFEPFSFDVLIVVSYKPLSEWFDDDRDCRHPNQCKLRQSKST